MINTEMYALLNPDLKRMGIRTHEQLIQHWNRRGKKEHRPLIFQRKFPFFNHDQYRKNYPDLASLSNIELEIHWLKVGIRQQRTYQQINRLRLGKKEPYMEKSHIKIFTNIYENEVWGKSEHEGFRGSPGQASRIDYAIGSFIPFMRKLFEINNIKTVVDIGCGNFDWAKPIYENLNIRYHGYEAYGALVEYNRKNHPEFSFTHIDALNDKERLESADICILKDVLEHWSNQDITTFLDYVVTTKKYKYILVVNCCRQTEDNKDIPTGGFRDLDVTHLPLRKYRPKKLYDFSIKEVSMIFT